MRASSSPACTTASSGRPAHRSPASSPRPLPWSARLLEPRGRPHLTRSRSFGDPSNPKRRSNLRYSRATVSGTASWVTAWNRQAKEGHPMEGYEVVTIEDEKVGKVVGQTGDYLIIEQGMLRKSKHAVPRELANVNESE